MFNTVDSEFKKLKMIPNFVNKVNCYLSVGLPLASEVYSILSLSKPGSRVMLCYYVLLMCNYNFQPANCFILHSNSSSSFKLLILFAK